MATTQDSTALYRLYDAQDALLYVGIAHRPETRWGQHAQDKEWWPEVKRYEVAWHESREEAVLAESAAVASEGPRHNVAESPSAARLKLASMGPDAAILMERYRRATVAHEHHTIQISESADERARVLAKLNTAVGGSKRLTYGDIAELTGLSRARAQQLVERGRSIL